MQHEAMDAGERRRIDEGRDEEVGPHSSALISQLSDEVTYLRDENRRKDEIIMQQAMTMRQLTAAPPQEPPEAAETVEEELGEEAVGRVEGLQDRAERLGLDPDEESIEEIRKSLAEAWCVVEERGV